MNTDTANTITLKHLIKLYGKEKGLNLFQAYKSKIFTYHGLAWDLGRRSLHYFCELFLHDLLFDYSNGSVPLSETHYKLWDEIQDTILNRKNTRDCYVLPRRFGKTTTITTTVALWVALYRIHPFVVVDSAIKDRATDFIQTMKLQLEGNEYISKCFGEVVNKELTYNTEEFELDIKPQRSKVKAVSSTSSVRGINYGSYRPGLLILDDAQDDKQIKTEQECADLISRINGGIMKALQDNSNVIALGTIQRKGDLYDTFLRSPIWRVKTRKCVLIDDIDKYFRESEGWQEVKRILLTKSTSENENAIFDAENYYMEHKKELDFPLIWENYDCFDLALEYFDDPVVFKKERQCDINTLGEKRIKALSALPQSDIESHEFTNTILSVDPATTNKRKADYSAFCVLSDTDNHIKYARKCIIDKLEFDDYIKMVISLLVAYPDINILSIEKNVYMGADVIKLREIINSHPELSGRQLTIINKSRTKNKDNRIDAIIPDINMGRVIFNDEDVDAIEQIKEFAGTAYTEHDDMIDALADAIENISNVKEQLPYLKVFDFNYLRI